MMMGQIFATHFSSIIPYQLASIRSGELSSAQLVHSGQVMEARAIKRPITLGRWVNDSERYFLQPLKIRNKSC